MSGKNNITVRKQKIRKNHTKAKLVFFLVLTALLLFVAAFAKYLCPYDPYAQDLALAQKPPGPEHLLGTDRYGRDMLSRVIIGSTTSIYATLLLVAVITVVGTAIGIFCGWKGGKADTVGRQSRYRSDAYLRSVPGFSGTGICPGSSRCSGRRYPECDHCPGSDQLAEVCETCQRAYSDSEGLRISYGGEAFRKQYRKASVQTYPSQYRRPHPCYVSS